MKDSLGERIKRNYEDRYRSYLLRRVPAIIRLDGKAFHTLTKNCQRPFDHQFMSTMDIVTKQLFSSIPGCIAAYTQSDEISLLLQDYENINTEAWFDYNVQKLVSISAAMASVAFSISFDREGFFDARCFSIPKEEVANYFYWRAKDCERNSIQMVARTFYSHEELNNIKTNDLHEYIYRAGSNWLNYPPRSRNGLFIYKNGDRNKEEITVSPDVLSTLIRQIV